MARQIMVRDLVRWLTRNGFSEPKGKMTGHRFFVKEGRKITIPGHGPSDLSKKHVALIFRSLKEMGFDPDKVRNEL